MKTNLVDWLAMSPELALEARISSRLTLDVALAANPFKISIENRRVNNLRFEPELRYWFNRPMARHFMALSALGGIFDVKWVNKRYEGDIWGAGLSYGYALVLNKHWNLEGELGVGLVKIRAFDYRQGELKPNQPNYSKFTVAPIRASLSFSYIFSAGR